MRTASTKALVRVVVLTLTAFFSLTTEAVVAAEKAADFSLKANTGKNLRLSEHRGEVVMINFWATWCVGCRDEMPQLNELYQRYRAAGFTVLGINVDEKRAAADEMVKALGVTFPVLYDIAPDDVSDYSKFRTARLYQVRKMPITFLVDRNGRVRYVHEGYRRGDEDEYNRKIRELLKE